MQIYIPEFWCGVIGTVLVELAALVFYSAWLAKKKRDEEEWE